MGFGLPATWCAFVLLVVMSVYILDQNLNIMHTAIATTGFCLTSLFLQRSLQVGC